MAEYCRGDVVYINRSSKENAGNHVISGTRPAVIVQNDVGNIHSPNLLVAYLTSKLKKIELPTHVLITCYEGLRPSIIQTEQLGTVDKRDVQGFVTHLRDEDVLRLDRALGISVGLKAL